MPLIESTVHTVQKLSAPLFHFVICPFSACAEIRYVECTALFGSFEHIKTKCYTNRRLNYLLTCLLVSDSLKSHLNSIAFN